MYVSSLDIVNSIYVRVFVRILHLAATSMGVKHEGTMMSSFVYATTSMFAGQCRVLMFMLGVHNTDKLQAGKKNTNMDPETGCATTFVF